MEIQPEEPGKPLKRDEGCESAVRTAESIKAKRGKILNLCFTTAGLRGRKVWDKRQTTIEEYHINLNSVTLTKYFSNQVFK